MDLVTCSKCGKMHPRGYKCGKRVYADTEARRLRRTYRWKRKAEQIKADSMNLCEVCLKLGIYTYDGLETHHITKLSEDRNGLLEDTNLITLCTYHHKQADRGQLDADYLRGLAKERIKRCNTL